MSKTDTIKYRLTYFHSRGRAEATRLVLAAAGQDFEDVRFTGEQWQKVKEEKKDEIFLEQLPVLEVQENGGDWKMIPESGATLRYVARAHGFYGEGHFENSMVDAVTSQIDEMVNMHLLPLFFEKDETEKKVKSEQFTSEVLPKYIGRFEKFLEKNGGDGWLVGKTMTIADIGVFNLFEMFQDAVQKLSEKKLFALMNRVSSDPKIKAWIEKRPKTDH